ncbi:hypothetical protein JAAARDRAFT_30722 [Jaapia argillacea MUCL 33604]|uniref:N-acetyltransferase domain-containing protein n=1 Tax=Jaapia argillacea MUCL 33604 TaxID=933084 RepID=A0A067QH10_9AGAM|nr:hypothetical protein JAAARDRAFT_30722 [Jaapia argillacea MUCL 33604]
MAQDPYTLFPIPTPVSDSHLTAFSTLRLLSLHTDPSRFCSTYARESVFTPDIWRSRLDDNNKVTFIVSTRSSLPPNDEEEEWVAMMTILGPAALRNIPHDTPVEISARGELFMIVSMWVHPTHRGKGLGSQLIRAGFDHVEKYQVGKLGDGYTGELKLLVLEVLKDNEDARRLYAKESFVEVGEGALCQGGGSVWMAKSFY